MSQRLKAVLAVVAFTLLQTLAAWAEPESPPVKTYSDAKLGYSFSYPASMVLNTDKDALNQGVRAGLDALKSMKIPQEVLDRLGVQWSLSLYPMNAIPPGKMNPNLVMLTEYVLNAGAVHDSKEYAEAALASALKIVPSTAVRHKIAPVAIGGRTFYSYSVTFDLAQAHFRQQHFVYYDTAAQIGYAFGITDVDSEFDQHYDDWMRIIHTLKFTTPARETGCVF